MSNKIILSVGLISAAVLAYVLFFGFGNQPTVTVYKSPSCQCCSEWVDHLENNGFDTRVENISNTVLVKNEFGIDQKLHSCHTATINDYVVEGHVPADLIHKMLRNKPEFKGLAVPGMPNGSPGMEGSGFKEPYKVFSFTEEGQTSVYAQR
jgi:hypothetical protein